MNIDRVTRRRSGDDLDAKDTKATESSSRIRRGFLKKDKNTEAPAEEPRLQEQSMAGSQQESAGVEHVARPSPRPARRMPREDGQAPFDELSMPIKVRNRTQSDEYPPARSASARSRVPDAASAFGRSPAQPDDRPAVMPTSSSWDDQVEAAKADYAGAEPKPDEIDDEWRGGTWEDSGYSATDEEAHRDKVYSPPNFLIQMLIVMFAQMKLFAKGKATIILIVMIALMPIMTLVIPDILDALASSFGATVSNAYTGLLLVLLPLVMALFTAKQCGTQIPNEFKDRTAYMSIPLPMHRLSFYFGKFLAGFLYCTALFLLAFGVAVACTAVKFDSFYIDVLLQAFVGTVVAILVYSSTAFCIGTFMRRGSVLVPLVLNLVAFPMLFFVIIARFDATSLMLMPVFLPDAVVQTLGFPMSGSFMGFLSAVLASGMPTAGFGDLWTMCGLGVIWGAAFLALGAFRMTRREM